MKKLIWLCSFLLGTMGSSGLLAQADWKIFNNGNTEQMVSGTEYYLKAIHNSYHLRYEKREFGINLGWKKEAAPNFKFVRQGGGKINCGDKIAIYVKGGGYVKYKKRRWGINLDWSETPVYEWEIRNTENKQGTPINTNSAIGIYNQVENDFMLYCVRVTPTVNLGWSKDCQGGWRIPGRLNGIKDYLPYLEKAIKYSAPLLL